MLREERLWRISQILSSERKVLANELAKDFGLTPATIRVDLAELEERGLARRVYGGAVLPDSLATYTNLPASQHCIADRQGLLLAEKAAIGRAAAALVHDGETLMIDGGTTTMPVCCHLAERRNLTIVSCAVNELWHELATKPGLDIFLTGGFYRLESQSLVGGVAENTLRGFRATKAIIGIDGISLEHGLTTINFLEANVKIRMIENSQELIIVADHTKLDRVGLMPVASLEQVSKIVTDSKASPEFLQSLEERGLQVIIAEPD